MSLGKLYMWNKTDSSSLNEREIDEVVNHVIAARQMLAAPDDDGLWAPRDLIVEALDTALTYLGVKSFE